MSESMPRRAIAAALLHAMLAAACLAWAAHLKDPHLLIVRAFEGPLLALAGLGGLALSLRSTSSPGWLRAAFLAAWLAMLGMVALGEYQFHQQKRTVLAATADDARRLAILGEHLVVGYGNVEDARELARRGFIAGLFVTRRNAAGKTFEQLRSELAGLQLLRRQAGLPPLIIASDQEGGPISRLSPPLPRQPALATLLAPGLSPSQIEARASDFGIEQGRAMASLGVNVNFSPVVDLKPAAPIGPWDLHTHIGERAIAGDPETVGRVALAYGRGLLSQGVLPTLKHFPGLGSVAEDTHHSSAHLRLTLAELSARDWPPFREVLERIPALLMVGHVIVDAVDPDEPASISPGVLGGILRGKWKYGGILISDDMTMAAAYNRGLCRSSVRALNSSMDLLLVSYDWEKVYPVLECLLSADKAGELEDMEASRTRLLAAKKWVDFQLSRGHE